MGTCASCNSFILFGGKKQGARRYCSDRCLQGAQRASAAAELPADAVRQRVAAIHQGLCPKCGGTGPVEVHVGHRVWSAFVLTSWASRPHVCCRSCGVRSQLGDALFSLLLGWWGFPWGLLMTPVQVVRNVIAVAKPPNPAQPSAQLEAAVRTLMAAELLAAGKQERAA